MSLETAGLAVLL